MLIVYVLTMLMGGQPASPPMVLPVKTEAACAAIGDAMAKGFHEHHADKEAPTYSCEKGLFLAPDTDGEKGGTVDG
jgi:hypothetical protein